MKIPKAEKLPSGTWRIRMRLNGESVSITANSKRECISKATLTKAEYKSGKRQSRSSGDMTISQAIDMYIKAKSNSLSPATVRGYRIAQRNRFQEYMDKPLSRIDDWQAVYDSEKGKVASKTLNNSFSLIESVYKFTTKTQLAEIAKVPTVSAERPFLDYEEITAFCEQIKGKHCEIGALLALHSLRASELLHLKWSDINFKKNTIDVCGATVPNENNKFVDKDTNKTDKSRRTVPIFMPQLSSALAKARKQDDERIVDYTSSGLNKAINRICVDLALPKVGIHGLRHSFASLCFHLEIPEETAMMIGGWSDFQTMRKIYTHLSQKDYNKHVDDLKNFFAHENDHNI